MKLTLLLFVTTLALPVQAIQQRDTISFLRGPYVMEFFSRHKIPWRHQAAIHAAHGGAHDMAHATAPEDRADRDKEFDRRMVKLLLKEDSKNGPAMETYGPLSAQFVWDLFRAIDWTHMHHEQTYDILSDADIPMHKKNEWTQRSVKYYLENFDLPRSVAPLEITMRRAGTMLKPYFSLFRNNFPQSNSYFWVAHWWHPAIYEAMILGGNGSMQDKLVQQADGLVEQFLKDRPHRMLLSREMMPRYSMMNPETANIFDNLHMLHGIAYDILTYQGWSAQEKQKEMKRVLKAMQYQPGDENLARKFTVPHPNMDPTKKEKWMTTLKGSMNKIMREMLEEMLPVMVPDLTAEQRTKIWDQFYMKMRDGLQPGEHEGSLHDALKSIIPNMKMNSNSSKPGVTPKKMIKAMMQGYQNKYSDLKDVPSYQASKK